jgi:hypothetical protein
LKFQVKIFDVLCKHPHDRFHSVARDICCALRGLALTTLAFGVFRSTIKSASGSIARLPSA